tara:strand:+ start:1512 stop:2540 length:1029 start_codon:yes stop_codon:yes gene_type:complete
MQDHTRLNKIENIGDSTLSPLMQDNVIEFFDWAIINAGGFYNVEIPTSGHYGGDKHKLRLVDDPRYNSGQVWEGFRSNWVWQSGLASATQPNTITKVKPDAGTYPNAKNYPGVSGIFVDGNFQPASGAGTYAYHIDYPNGRVVFDTAISTTSTVTAEFSHKWVDVIRANSDFFREVQYRSFRADGDFTLTGSGDYSQLAENRLQLPVIAVEMVQGRNLEPYALGTMTHYVNTDVLFHVMAEEDYTRDKLLDIVSLQEEKTILMFDSDRIGRNDAFPLDYRGMVKNDALRYPELVKPSGESGYRYGGVSGSVMTFKEATVQVSDAFNENLYHGVVRMNTEVIT